MAVRAKRCLLCVILFMLFNILPVYASDIDITEVSGRCYADYYNDDVELEFSFFCSGFDIDDLSVSVEDFEVYLTDLDEDCIKSVEIKEDDKYSFDVIVVVDKDALEAEDLDYGGHRGGIDFDFYIGDNEESVYTCRSKLSIFQNNSSSSADGFDYSTGATYTSLILLGIALFM